MSHLNLRSSKRKLDQKNDESSKAKEMKTSDELPETATISDAAGMGTFNNLNQDVFEEIASFLEVKDILNLCLTSKTMNGLIGSNEKIMRRITLQFPKLQELEENDFGQRNYRKIAFKNCIRIVDLLKVLPFIKKISSHAKDIELGEQLSFSVGVYIIKHFKGANQICANFSGNLQERFIEPTLRPSKTALDFSHLKVLKINNVWSNFYLFENCQLLEKFSLSEAYCDEEDLPRLQQFIMKQTRLKSLTFGCNIELFKDNTLAESKFKLKEFDSNFSFCNSNPEAEVNFQNFLTLHVNTLERFSANDLEILEFTRDFPNLKTVKLQLDDHDVSLKRMRDVNFVIYKGESWNQLNFSTSAIVTQRNLKEFSGQDIQFNSSLNHGSIEKLFLHSCTFSNINMPNLRSVTLCHINLPLNMCLQINVQELILHSCRNAENFLAFIDDPNANLKLLEISNMKLTSRRIIDSNLHKIHKLIINKVTFST